MIIPHKHPSGAILQRCYKREDIISFKVSFFYQFFKIDNGINEDDGDENNNTTETDNYMAPTEYF